MTKIEITRFKEIEGTTEYSELISVYDGHDSLDYCLLGYKHRLQSLWANSGLVEGEAPLVHLSHYFDDQSLIHKFLCIFDDWDVKYYGIETWPERIDKLIKR